MVTTISGAPAVPFYMQWQLWFWLAIILFLFFCFYTILLIILAKKTHALIEFKAWRKGIPICMFFMNSGYVDWIPIKTEAGLIEHPDYGTYLINNEGTYIDKTTKNIIIPFDTDLATSINVSAAKLADDLKFILRDDKELAVLREAIMTGKIDDEEIVNSLKMSVNFSSIKGMMNAMVPHNITAKIEKMIALRLKGHSKINVPQLLLIFCVILGAIILGVIIIKSVLGNGGAATNIVQGVSNAGSGLAQQAAATASSSSSGIVTAGTGVPVS